MISKIALEQRANEDREAATKRIKELEPVTKEEIEQLVDSGTTIDVGVIVRRDNWGDGGPYIGYEYRGILMPAEKLHPGKAEDAAAARNLHLMIYGGNCLITNYKTPGEVFDIYSPEEAEKSPLSPNVLRIYHGKDRTYYVIDMPINRFTLPGSLQL